MSRLPIVGGDSDVWGEILNDFLSVSLNPDGTLKSSAAGPTGPAGAGLVAGGSTGQMLVKKSNTDYDTKWKNNLDWINVKDYGAGNGVDDTAAINAAIAAGGGSGAVIYFPAGNYFISSPLVIDRSGTTLMGAGSQTSIIQISLTSWSGNKMIDVQIHDVMVRDLGFDGQNIGTAVDGIRITGTYLVTVMDCTAYNCTGWFINVVDNGLSGAQEIRLANLFYEGTAGIHLQNFASPNGLPMTASLTNITIFIFGAGDGLFIEGARDISCINIQIKLHTASSAFSAVHIKGACRNIQIANASCGSAASSNYAGTTYLIEEDGSSNRPSNVKFTGGSTTGQGIGLSVDCDDFVMTDHTIAQSQTNGIDIVGAGSNIVLQNVLVQQSGLATTNTYYDFKVTNTTGVVMLSNCFGESTGTTVAANLLSTANTQSVGSVWSATTAITGPQGPWVAMPDDINYNAAPTKGHFYYVNGALKAGFDNTGNLNVLEHLYPGDESYNFQASGGLLHSAGVPNNANGNNNDWCISNNGQLYFKSGGVWGALVGAVTSVAGRSGAVTLTPADLLGPLPSGDTTGATDSAAIAAAIAALPAAGGVISLAGGTYYINATIVVPQHSTLQGLGAETTTIKMANAANLDAVVAGDNWFNNATDSGYPIIVQDIGIDGNKANQSSGVGHGIAFMNFRSEIRRNRITGARGDGIHYSSRNKGGVDITNNSVESTIEYNEIHSCTGNGILVANPASDSAHAATDGWCLNNICNDSGLVAISIESAAGWVIENNHVYSVTGTLGTGGIYAAECFATRLAKNYVEDFGGTASSGTYFGIFVGANVDAGGTAVADNVIRTPELGNAGTTYVGLACQANTGACNFTVSGNLIGSTKVSSPTLQGIWLYANGGGSGFGTVTGNNVQPGAGLLLDASAAMAGMLIANNSFNYAAAFPTTGSWTKGTVVWNTGVAAGGSPGWVCTTGGTSGTWKTMATVAP